MAIMLRMAASKPSRSRAERRDTPRIPTVIDAMVKTEDRPFQLFNTRDLSLDGTFVEKEPERLKLKTVVEIALKIPNGGAHAQSIYRFSARVARITPHGVGVTFDHVNTDSYAALMEFIFLTKQQGAFSF